MISEGFWSEWGDLNTQPRHPKCRALPVELHPDIHFSAMIPRRGVKIKIFLSVVIYVVKPAFVPLSATGWNPANAGVKRLCGVSPHPVPDTATALPNQARYQLRYTRIFNFCHDTTANGKNKVFSVCGHSCGQSRFCAAFGNQGKSRKHRRRKALRHFALPYPGYNHGTPKASALPTALIPDLVIEFCARCGQTCGQAVFLTISACGGRACIAGVSRDCGHCISRLEGGATCSQTYVWTFSEGSCALFGTFRHSCGSSLELYWPVYFRHRFRLLGFVWDWILYIKSASDRVYLQQRVLFAAESSSETAPHKQRNKRDDKETAGWLGNRQS